MEPWCPRAVVDVRGRERRLRRTSCCQPTALFVIVMVMRFAAGTVICFLSMPPAKREMNNDQREHQNGKRNVGGLVRSRYREIDKRQPKRARRLSQPRPGCLRRLRRLRRLEACWHTQNENWAWLEWARTSRKNAGRGRDMTTDCDQRWAATRRLAGQLPDCGSCPDGMNWASRRRTYDVRYLTDRKHRAQRTCQRCPGPAFDDSRCLGKAASRAVVNTVQSMRTS